VTLSGGAICGLFADLDPPQTYYQSMVNVYLTGDEQRRHSTARLKNQRGGSAASRL
jgi:hypothetical protein